jgi:hypothetical protein
LISFIGISALLSINILLFADKGYFHAVLFIHAKLQLSCSEKLLELGKNHIAGRFCSVTDFCQRFPFVRYEHEFPFPTPGSKSCFNQLGYEMLNCATFVDGCVLQFGYQLWV